MVTTSSFGYGYVDGELVEDSERCTGVLRVSWEGDRKPLVAWQTTSLTVEPDEHAWSYDPRVSTTNDADNPFYAHSSPSTAFSSRGWMESPPEAFDMVEGDNWIEIRGNDALFTPTTVTAGIAHDPAMGPEGTSWSARYYCLEDGAPE